MRFLSQGFLRLLCFAMVFTTLQGLAQPLVQVGKDSVSFRGRTISRDSLQIMRFRDSLNRVLNMNDTLVTRQLENLEKYAGQLSVMENLLRRGFDSSEIVEGLAKINIGLQQARESVISSTGSNNLRNLVSTKVLLQTIRKKLDTWGKDLRVFEGKLSTLRSDRLAMVSDSMMRKIPGDPVLRAEYINRLVQLGRKFRPLDSTMQLAVIRLGVLDNRLLKTQLEVNDYLDELDFRILEFNRKMFRKEYGYLWAPVTSKRSFAEIVSYSIEKNKLIFKFYFDNSWPARIFNIVLFVLLCFAAFRARTSLRRREETLILKQAGHSASNPSLAAFFIVIVFSIFVYSDAPDIFLQFLWLLAVISFTLLVYREFSPPLKFVWSFFLPLFLLSAFDYALLQGNRDERILILLLAIAGLVLALYSIKQVKDDDRNAKILRFNLWLFTVQMGISIIANLLGRYTIAKNMMAGGYMNMMAAFCLLWWVYIMVQLVYLLVEANRHNQALIPYINFSRFTEETRRVLNIAAIIAWMIIFARNLNVYYALINAGEKFLLEERAIGNFSFTLGSILIFFLIIWVSSLLASVVAFLLGGDKNQVGVIKKSRFGNVILLVRLTVMSLGFLLAIAAAGIPVDKITIIIGALGVGIGFGLQNVVNNLVSGIILAFERPITVGDQIEVAGRLGKVKEIGIRSSRLATFDGSEVIIPNGDLISQHVVNWTLSSNLRRAEILVGVKYGTDLVKVQEILNHVIDIHTEIVKFPKPLVLAYQFGASSIDFRLLFWTDIDLWPVVKSQIINEIDIQFKQNGIEIPFPQQDLHLRSVDEKLLEKLASKPASAGADNEETVTPAGR